MRDHQPLTLFRNCSGWRDTLSSEESTASCWTATWKASSRAPHEVSWSLRHGQHSLTFTFASFCFHPFSRSLPNFLHVSLYHSLHPRKFDLQRYMLIFCTRAMLTLLSSVIMQSKAIMDHLNKLGSYHSESILLLGLPFCWSVALAGLQFLVGEIRDMAMYLDLSLFC